MGWRGVGERKSEQLGFGEEMRQAEVFGGARIRAC